MDQDAGAVRMMQFVLIHGACHGAWSWFKVSDLLRKAGYAVVALDMGASGINPNPGHEITSLESYSQPLLNFLEKLPDTEKVIVVGHSFGGFSISLAMEMFPHKIAAAVFVAAFMPLSGVSNQEMAKYLNDFQLGDSKIQDSEDGLPLYFEFGRSYAREYLYQNCSTKDMVLADSLRRPIPFFGYKIILTKEKYGSVKRACVVCKQDKILPFHDQLNMIKENPPYKVFAISESDHFSLFCCPDALTTILSEISMTF